MGIILGPDTIQIGMFITVLRYKPKEIVNQRFPSFLDGDEWKNSTTTGTTTKIECEDRSFMGDVLRVLAIQYPYIVIHKEDKSPSCRFRYSIDMRRTYLMQLDKEYIITICPHLENELNEKKEHDGLHKTNS